MRALVVSDKSSEDMKKMMSFYYGFNPESVITVNHYHELTTEQRDKDNVLIHVQQRPIELTETYPLETYFEFLSASPYNQPTSWIKSFDYAIVSTVDDKSERRYHMLHS
jgi:hypothetical protein